MTDYTGTSFLVSIKDGNRSSLPFGNLNSRNGVAIVLSFFGCSQEVLYLMQRFNHKSRAYISNAGGLKGFLVPQIIAILKEANRNGEIQYVARYQKVDI